MSAEQSHSLNRQPAWPHAPVHRLSENGTYFVTAGTYRKVHCFRGRQRLGVLHRGLLTLARDFGWLLEAWAVFSNHYHFIAHSPGDEDGAAGLSTMLGRLHEKTAKWVNRLDGETTRTVWHNFWDTRLTYPKSYLARLNYVHQNPVKHGLVRAASLYPWCSAGWFERTARPAQVQMIYGVPIDRVKVRDEYDVPTDGEAYGVRPASSETTPRQARQSP
jgi:REP-associated tyrosine transposase